MTQGLSCAQDTLHSETPDVSPFLPLPGVAWSLCCDQLVEEGREARGDRSPPCRRGGCHGKSRALLALPWRRWGRSWLPHVALGSGTGRPGSLWGQRCSESEGLAAVAMSPLSLAGSQCCR